MCVCVRVHVCVWVGAVCVCGLCVCACVCGLCVCVCALCGPCVHACVCVCMCVLQASSLPHAVCLSACPSSLPSHLSPAHPELLESSGPGGSLPAAPEPGAQSWAQESWTFIRSFFGSARALGAAACVPSMCLLGAGCGRNKAWGAPSLWRKDAAKADPEADHQWVRTGV